MKRITLFFMSIFLILALSGCATVLTYKAERDEKGNIRGDSKGIRVYPTRLYLIVKAEETEIKYLPDYSGAYDVKPLTILSKNDFVITIKEGQIKSCGAAIDTSDGMKAASAVLKDAELVKSADGTSDTAPPKPDSTGGTTQDAVTPIVGNLGLKPGIYMLDNSGNITQVIKMEEIITPEK